MREYEFALITRGTLQEKEHQAVLQKYENILTENGGEILKKDEWGLKKIAFPMKKCYRGYYTFYDLASQPENFKEAERQIRIDENVLRHMVIRLDEEVDVETRKQEIAQEAAKAQTSSEEGDEDLQEDDE